MAIPANGLRFDPLPVQALGMCVCLLSLDSRATSEAFGLDVDFGPGNTADGVIACGPNGLSGVDYNIEADSSGLREGELKSGGGGRRGSGRLRAFVGLSILNGDCSPGNFDNGPDGIACTADDEPLFSIGVAALTTGSASGAILNADLVPGQNLVLGCRGDCDRNGSVQAHELVQSLITLGKAPSALCPLVDADGNGQVDRTEVAAVTDELFGCGLSGQPFDCDAIERGADPGMASLAFASPAVGGVLGFDSVLSGEIVLVADLTPTLSPTRTASATTTPTRTITSTPTMTPTRTPSPVPTIPGAPTATRTHTPQPTPTITLTPTPTPCGRTCCFTGQSCEDPVAGFKGICKCCASGKRKCTDPGSFLCELHPTPAGGEGDGCE